MALEEGVADLDDKDLAILCFDYSMTTQQQ